MTKWRRAVLTVGICCVAGDLLAAFGHRIWAAGTIVAGVAAGIIPYDLQERRIPTALVTLGITATAIAAAFSSVDETSWAPLVNGLVGYVVVGGAFLAVHLIQPSGMGFGDVRLAAAVGALVGYGTTNITAAAVTAGIAAVASSIAMLATRTRTIPFAPFILAAAGVVLVVDGVT